MNITYDFRRCVDTATCIPFVTLYKYDTDGILANDSERINPDNYRPLFGTIEASRIQKGDSTGPVTEMLSFVRTGNREGFYLAFVDTGTCATVERVLLYYRVVVGRNETFLRCPDVALPVAGDQTLSRLSCTCVNSTSGVGSLERACNQDGVCNEDQRCECEPGFGYNSTVEVCIGECEDNFMLARYLRVQPLCSTCELERFVCKLSTLIELLGLNDRGSE